MTKQLKPIARIAVLSIAAALAASSAGAQGPGWTANGKVVKLVNTANGGVNIRMSPDLVECTSQSGYGPNFASVYPNHPGINRIKADLLTAYVTGETITLYLVDSSCTVSETLLGGW